MDFTEKQRKTGEYHWFRRFRRIIYDQIHFYLTTHETSTPNKGRKKAVFKPKNAILTPHNRQKMADFGILKYGMSFLGRPWMACKFSAQSAKAFRFRILGASEMKNVLDHCFERYK